VALLVLAGGFSISRPPLFSVSQCLRGWFGFPITRDDGDDGDFGDLHSSVSQRLRGGFVFFSVPISVISVNQW
jgi:hypothetical protein